MTAMASARSRYLRRMCGGAVHARRGERSRVREGERDQWKRADPRTMRRGGVLRTIGWRRCGAAERAQMAAREGSAWVWVSPVVWGGGRSGDNGVDCGRGQRERGAGEDEERHARIWDVRSNSSDDFTPLDV